MRRQLVIAAASSLVLALGTAGTMAQTPYGSSSQSAPPGLNSNPSAEIGRTPGTTVTKKKTKTLKETQRSRGHTTGSSSQSAPPGLDYNPATRSR